MFKNKRILNKTNKYLFYIMLIFLYLFSLKFYFFFLNISYFNIIEVLLIIVVLLNVILSLIESKIYLNYFDYFLIKKFKIFFYNIVVIILSVFINYLILFVEFSKSLMNERHTIDNNLHIYISLSVMFFPIFYLLIVAVKNFNFIRKKGDA
jgi:hypothetical protein